MKSSVVRSKAVFPPKSSVKKAVVVAKLRRCPLCDEVFDLHQLCIADGCTPKCPTTDCQSTPDTWGTVEDPLTSETAWRVWQKMLERWEKRHDVAHAGA